MTLQVVDVRSKMKLLLPVLALLGWVAWELWVPRRASLRDFDPNAVARLETRMWRAYYDRREGALFRDLSAMLRTQYHMSWLRSYGVAYSAARAAGVFRRGRVRADYEEALPLLLRYYTAIRAASDTPFDPGAAARLELEWWIVHRQREFHAAEDLERALAAVQAEIYALPAERFTEHAKRRAEAMTLRDGRAAVGVVTDADWERIEDLLRASWGALARAVQA